MNGTPSPKVFERRGIVLGTLDQYQYDQPDRLWQYADGSSLKDCLIPSPDLLHGLLSQPITDLHLQFVDWSAHHGPLPVLTACWPCDQDFALYSLPEDICPVAGVFMGILELVETLKVRPLYRMVVRIFREREVVARFWTMPASARHHHAFPGGLAAHSLEVARDLAGQDALNDHERELSIAAGLLHDLGKVWSYADRMGLSAAGRAMGHELVGLSRLERELKVLEGDWPDGAYAMRVLLSGCGRMRQDGSMPSALLARLKAADQRSCEQERSARAPDRVWTPVRWRPAAPDSSDPMETNHDDPSR